MDVFGTQGRLICTELTDSTYVFRTIEHWSLPKKDKSVQAFWRYHFQTQWPRFLAHHVSILHLLLLIFFIQCELLWVSLKVVYHTYSSRRSNRTACSACMSVCMTVGHNRESYKNGWTDRRAVWSVDELPVKLLNRIADVSNRQWLWNPTAVYLIEWSCCFSVDKRQQRGTQHTQSCSSNACSESSSDELLDRIEACPAVLQLPRHVTSHTCMTVYLLSYLYYLFYEIHRLISFALAPNVSHRYPRRPNLEQFWNK